MFRSSAPESSAAHGDVTRSAAAAERQLVCDVGWAQSGVCGVVRKG
jgi:hypothetical protein